MKILNAYIHTAGIKKRCRKVETHTLELGDFPLETTEETLKPLAIKKIREEMKSLHPTYQHKLKTQEIEIEKFDTYETRSFMMFTGVKTYRIKCNSCNAISINGRPCHESGCTGTFQFIKRGKTYALYRVWSLDVWGNKNDGFEVNDRSNRGSIMVPEDCSDKKLIDTLRTDHYLHHIHLTSLVIDGDENHIDISFRKTGEPIYQLERQ